MKTTRIGLLITGNEVLSAKTKDTNGPFMGMHLRKIGLPVRASMMCADEESSLLDCLTYLAERCDIILMTGGLGPTSDDLTSEVVAKFFGLKTVFYEEAWENCLAAYKKFNRKSVPESNKKQALLPDGSKILVNKIGTAVGFKVTGKKMNKMVSIYCMPGVPYEMEPMFLNEVYPELTSQRFPPIAKTWQVFLMGESAMQSAIEEAEKKLQCEFPQTAISYQAHPGFVTYSVALSPRSEGQRDRYQDYLENEFIPAVHKSFHKHILYSQDLILSEYLVKFLKDKECTLSFVEGSCGGILSKEVSIVRHAENVLKGSIILNPLHTGEKISLNRLQDIMQLEFMQSDICVAEWGSPAFELATKDNPHGRFYISLSIRKQKIKNEIHLQQKLEGFCWKKETEFVQNSEWTHYLHELNVSTRYGKEVQQTRVALHCLCSLALLVDHL